MSEPGLAGSPVFGIGQVSFPRPFSKNLPPAVLRAQQSSLGSLGECGMVACKSNIYMCIYGPCKQLADFPPGPVSPVIYTSVSLPDSTLNRVGPGNGDSMSIYPPVCVFIYVGCD